MRRFSGPAPAIAALALVALAAGPALSGAAPGHHRTRAVLARAQASPKRSAHVVLLAGALSSPYGPCRANRVVRFYHRVGSHSFLLRLSLDPDLQGFSRRTHRTSPQGRIAIAAKVADPRAGAYFMTAPPESLAGGTSCLGAHSALRRAR